jgi:hypothetical protein
MPGLVPGIHVLTALNKKYVDGRDKPGHDGEETSRAGLHVSQRARRDHQRPNQRFISSKQGNRP